jgi:SpoIIAA-like
MTIETLAGNALKIVMPAKLTASDVAQVADRLDASIAQFSRIRVLFDLRNFAGWENMEALGAHLDQLKFIQERAKHIDRIAVVVGHPWQQQFVALIRNVLPAPVQPFESSEEAAATDWLLH